MATQANLPSVGDGHVPQTPALPGVTPAQLLNSLADGAYITDLNRTILFWNRAAERITGWTVADVVGKSCFDNILVHVDKDDHQLCGKEYCPLHRSIVTGEPSTAPLLVFARRKDGRKVPVEVSVSPIRDATGNVVAGIEVFHDLTPGTRDLQRAKLIQDHTLAGPPISDPRLTVAVRYVPCDIVGGDFYRVEAVGTDQVAFMVADVMGHGVASALYTMQMRVLWDDLRGGLTRPADFLTRLNGRLHTLVNEDTYFATATFGIFDLRTGEVRHCAAAHPAPFLLRQSGRLERVPGAGAAVGLFPEAEYEEGVARLAFGDRLLACTDGAFEIEDATGALLGEERFGQLLIEVVHLPGPELLLALEERLLRYGNHLRLADDLTLVLMEYRGG